MQSVNPVEYGDYHLTRKIATGGMAELFRARKVGEAGFEKLLVIKRLLPHLAEDEELRTMFLDEARLASLLTHANIVQVYDLGRGRASDPTRPEQQATYFIAMEYVFGKSLAEIIRRGQALKLPMSVENSVKVVLSAAQGLEYAHTKRDDMGQPLQLVHRDVSPQNILVSYEGEVKLVDFGIAKALNQSTTTRPGMLKGKFSYMSPEQAKGEAVDQRTDVYALGVVMWEALTGIRLFTGDTEAAILGKVVNPQVEPPSTENPDIPDELDGICMTCLDPEPENRYQNAQALCGAIEEYLQKLTSYPSTYSIRNYMHEIFKLELDEETGQIQKELEAVRSHVTDPKARAKAAEGAAPSDQPEQEAEPTQLYQGPDGQPPAKAKGGKGKLFAALGAALAIVIAAVFFITSGQKQAPEAPAPKAQAPAAEEQARAEKPAPKAEPAEAEQQARAEAKPVEPEAETGAKEEPAAPAPEGQARQASEPAGQPAGPKEEKPAEEPEPALVAEARQSAADGELDAALEKFRQADQQYPERKAQWAREQASALTKRAGRQAMGSPEKALGDLRQAAELDPGWADVYFQKGRILTRLKKLDQARQAYEKAVELNPKLDGAFFNLGYIQLTKGELGNAIANFQKVVELPSPYKADAYVNMAVCYARQGQKDKAIEALKTALMANPNHKLANSYLAKLTKAKKSK